MSSKIVERGFRSAAWRISLWSGVAFAIGTAIAFFFLQSFLANDIQNRADSWMTGELGVLADVAERTPANRLHDAVVGEVAELASREAPRDDTSTGAVNRSVFFLQTNAAGQVQLYTGAGNAEEDAHAVQKSGALPGRPADVSLRDLPVPYRVAEANLDNGNRIYLALSTRYEREILHRLRQKFAVLWCAIICFGTFLVFFSTRRTLYRIQLITDTAESIGRNNLRSRVPELARIDEISRLSLTLNKMLDRIEASVQQLHAMSDALAHDLRSPMTAVRGKLELALMSQEADEREEAIVRCIDAVDRVSSLLCTSLDVSEASADALRLRKERLDLDSTLRALVELYEPTFTHANLGLELRSEGPVFIEADPALFQRTIANLLDNELKHLRAGGSVTLSLQSTDHTMRLTVEDDGEGFSRELLPRVFDRYSKGAHSEGYGLGLAFVAAVVRSHDGTVSARNRQEGGAVITFELPLQTESQLAGAASRA